jgi:hypothetical protein
MSTRRVFFFDLFYVYIQQRERQVDEWVKKKKHPRIK